MELSHKPWPSILAAALTLVVLISIPGSRLAAEDRIAAVVDNRVITLSDLRWMVEFRDFRVPQDPQERRQFFLEILNQMINQTLILRETVKTPFIQVSDSELARFAESYQARFANIDAYHEKLRTMGIREKELLSLLGRQLAVNKFIELRFEPFIIVLPSEVRRYYSTVYVPELEETGQIAPPLELVEETIRQIMTVQRTTDELEKWLQNSRLTSGIQILYTEPQSERPNVPSTIEEKPLQPAFGVSKNLDSNRQ